MRFEGRVWQDGSHWLIEVPALHALSQGYSREEAYEMIEDLVETMVDQPGFEAAVYPKTPQTEVAGTEGGGCSW